MGENYESAQRKLVNGASHPRLQPRRERPSDPCLGRTGRQTAGAAFGCRGVSDPPPRTPIVASGALAGSGVKPMLFSIRAQDGVANITVAFRLRRERPLP